MLTESLNIYIIDKDGNKVTFPNVEGMQPAIVDVNLNRERMAGAPTNTSTLMYPVCLDSYWTKKEFIEIGSERYYVKQVPTSEKNTEDTRYKHEITFVSERDILENVFFFDCVTQDTSSQISDKPRSNTTDFSFYGDLNELIQRLNDSLSYSKIYDPKGENGFCIVIDDDVEIGEAKEVSMTDAYFATAMQEIYNVFEVPYYWVGKVCHVGYQENEITEPFEYGSGNGLISVQKTNAEFRLINRITGMGSADNIPYYYPNTDPNGIVEFETENVNNPDGVTVALSSLVASVGSDYLNIPFQLSKSPETTDFVFELNKADTKTLSITSPSQHTAKGSRRFEWSGELSNGTRLDVTSLKGSFGVSNSEMAKKLSVDTEYGFYIQRALNKAGTEWQDMESVPQNVDIVEPTGKWPYKLIFLVYFNIQQTKTSSEGWQPLNFLTINAVGEVKVKYSNEEPYKLLYGSKSIGYKQSGFYIPNISSQPCKSSTISLSWFSGGKFVFDITDDLSVQKSATIRITNVRLINIISKLMPSVYRETEGSERFYNAKNETYKDEQGEYYSFNNEYTPSEPLEGKQDFDDIKPTINGITNEKGELFGEIAAIAFDDNDSDDLMVEDASNANTNTAKPVHPYFYVKLHKFSGENGFNLFKQGLAQGAMTFNFITGSCAGCSFKVQVSEGKQVDNHYEFKNLVQVDEQGNIVAGDSGDKIKASNPIASQQDTMTNSVWVALEKDNSTFGVLMPNATNNYRPSAGDKFVITNILLPIQYITAAEKRLDAALVKYMSENNDEKFTFSIKFSRIYLQEHPEIAGKINENTKLHVKYNNVDYPLYVSSYSRKSDDNILDEISVELSEKLTIAQNKSKEQMDSIMGNVNEQINSAIQNNNNNNTSQGVSSNDINSLKALLSNKLSRVTNDTAAGIITFLKGLVSKGIISAKQGVEIGEFVTGLFGRGGKIDGDGRAELRSLTLWEWLEVPEIRFNRITVNIGLSIKSEGGGTIEKVLPDTDTDGNQLATGSCWLKLEDGEYGAIAVADLCMGMWHDLGGGNATENSDDKKGTYQVRGFKTIYFWINDVPDTDPDGLDNSDQHFFRYTLRSTLDGGNGMHPCAMMHFAQRGNTDNKERQSIVYSTTKYDLSLCNLDSWYFRDSQIYQISRCLDGFTMEQIGDDGKVYTKKFSGYGVVMGNAYIYGKIDEFERAGFRIDITRTMAGTVTTNAPDVIGIRVVNGYGADVSAKFTTYKVTRDSGDAESDAEWNAAHTSVGQELTITADDLGIAKYLQPVMFTVTASGEGMTDIATSFTERFVSTEELHIEFQPVEGKSYVVKASNVDTIIEARLYFGSEDITDSVLLRSSSVMKWTRDSGIPTEDAAWKATTEGSPNIIHIIDRVDDRHDCGSYWMEKLKVVFAFECNIVFAIGEISMGASMQLGNS